MKKIFTGLFEDEVAEELRIAGRACVIRSGRFTWYPACMICEDGIYTSGAGYYTEYIDGSRSDIVGIACLINYLAHKTFTIETED